jgi:acyl-CoA thioester hydrolase
MRLETLTCVWNRCLDAFYHKQCPIEQGNRSLTNYFDFRHSVVDDEIDAQGHVHNLHYLHWTLGAATAHVRQLGWDSKAALAKGFGWVVRNHDIKYSAAALAGDDLIIRTWISDVSQIASMRKYAICRPKDRKVLARVETRWVFVDLSVRKVIKIPPEAVAGLPVCDPPPPLPWVS